MTNNNNGIPNDGNENGGDDDVVRRPGGGRHVGGGAGVYEAIEREYRDMAAWYDWFWADYLDRTFALPMALVADLIRTIVQAELYEYQRRRRSPARTGGPNAPSPRRPKRIKQIQLEQEQRLERLEQQEQQRGEKQYRDGGEGGGGRDESAAATVATATASRTATTITVVDVGCGTGEFLRRLILQQQQPQQQQRQQQQQQQRQQQQPYEQERNDESQPQQQPLVRITYKGVEPSKEMLHQAELKCRNLVVSQSGSRGGDDKKNTETVSLEWINTTGERMERIPDDSVDVVASTSAFHFFRDRSRALREMHRVLKRGGRGRLVLTDWCADYWIVRLYHYAVDYLRWNWYYGYPEIYPGPLRSRQLYDLVAGVRRPDPDGGRGETKEKDDDDDGARADADTEQRRRDSGAVVVSGGHTGFRNISVTTYRVRVWYIGLWGMQTVTATT